MSPAISTASTAVLAGDVDDLGEDRPLLVEPVAALERLADVPVGGVQELHVISVLRSGGSCWRSERRASSAGSRQPAEG